MEAHVPSLITGETLRVLLISTSEEARDEIGDALAGRAGDYRLYWVSRPELALVRVGDVLPHVILVDDALEGVSPGNLIGQLAGRMPGAAILVLVQPDGLAVASQAMLAGARAFLVRPLDADEFVATLRQVLVTRRAAPAPLDGEDVANGRTVVFCAPKGGTGRTTMAINTAVSLRQSTKQPVVLVDADYAAPALDVALNLQQARNIADLLPRLTRLDQELVKSVLAEHASGVDVLLAPPPADLTSPITLPQAQQVLAWLKRMYPWVIVDLGLPMDETAFAFLDGSDRIIMSVLPEMIGLRNTRLMLDQMLHRGYPAEKTWLVLNRAGLPGGVSLADIEARLQVRINHQIPDDQALVTHSVNRGVPVMMSHSRSALARGFQRLGQMLAQEMPHEAGLAEPVERPTSSLFGRVLGSTRPARA
jgi:pilus assembly protein CpaE